MTEKILFNNFKKLDLKVGKILKVEDHPNANKLFVLKVDLGEQEPRTIVAGLKGHYSSKELENKQAIFIANLEPSNLRGVESNGMILAAVSENSSKIFIIIPKEKTKEGVEIEFNNDKF